VKAKRLFFETPAKWRKWLEKNHDRAEELWVGFYKKGSGKKSITWPESVDEALCFGWIDGVRKSIDEDRYEIRFSPRKPSSVWSKINIDRVKELTALGKMHDAGLAAFERRSGDRTGLYAYEQRHGSVLEPAYQAELEANEAAWSHFSARPPWYRKAAIHWIMSAKQEPTRRRRLGQLIECSAEGRPVPPLTPRLSQKSRVR
jgi:uncharacterized protein YdeI (YjbR/CyaY-like superfamily)